MAITEGLGIFEIPFMECRQSAPTPISMQLNDVNERTHFVGQIHLENGASGGSKTISSSGGKIHWRTGVSGITFANAGTTFRVGIQDVSTTSAPAQGDGTFDVYKDLVGGTDTITTSTNYATAMANGSKTIAHGQIIAVVLSMQSRGGTDDVRVQSLEHPLVQTQPQFPAVMHDTASVLRQAATPNCLIEFDDGTYGWFVRSTVSGGDGNTSFHVNTAGQDEHGNLLTVPFKMRAIGLSLNVAASTNTADFEAILYENPLVTPTVVEAITVDMTQVALHNIASSFDVMFSTERELDPAKTYGITLRPTTTTSITMAYNDVAASAHWKASGITGDNCYAICRLDNTGAFTDYNSGTAKTRRMLIALIIDAVDAAEASKGRAVTAIGI